MAIHPIEVYTRDDIWAAGCRVHGEILYFFPAHYRKLQLVNTNADTSQLWYENPETSTEIERDETHESIKLEQEDNNNDNNDKSE